MAGAASYGAPKVTGGTADGPEPGEGQALKLGFTGMVEAGIDPAEAWQIIVDDCRDPLVKAIFDDLASDEEGRAMLAESAERWRQLGMPPPWGAEE